jgi:ubiquitin-protein ligase
MFNNFQNNNMMNNNNLQGDFPNQQQMASAFNKCINNNNMNMNNMNNMNMNNMNNMNMNMNNNMGNSGNFNNNNMINSSDSETLARLKKEFQFCQQDNDLTQIGCTVGLDKGNLYKWKATITGPKNTPYEDGIFNISITFPSDYPDHGPEFKFINKIYHLNVDFQKDYGHICLNTLNSWRVSGKVNGSNIYTVKQALFDIFCLFSNQGVKSAYDEKLAELYVSNPEEFDKEARRWTKLYAS